MKIKLTIATQLILGTGLFWLAGASNLKAANGADTWTGGAGDNNWATPGNWSGVNAPPIAGDSLAFGAQGMGGLILNNNITAATSFAGLTFNAGAPAFVFNGNSIFTAGGIVDNSLNLETINLPISMTSAHTFGAVSGGAMLVGGVLSGTGGGINKTLGGTVTLTNNNTYTGATTASGGTLTLDFTGGAANNIVSTSSALTLAGGTLQINGSSTVASSQTFASTALSAGNSTISAAPVSGVNYPTVAIKAITPAAGGTVVFNGPATTTAASTASGQTGSAGNGTTTGFQAATATITTTSGTANQPLLSTTSGNVDYYCYGTVGLYDFAAVTGTTPFTITGLSQINSATSGLGTSGDGSYYVASTGLDVSSAEDTTHFDDIVGSFTVNANTTGIGGYRYNFNGALTTTIPQGSTYTTGGILVTPNVGANNTTLTQAGTGCYFEPGFRGGNAGSLAIWQNNIGGFLNLNVNLFDGKTAGGIWSQNGAGTVVYSGTNSFTTSLYLNGGVSEITTNYNLGAITLGATVNMNGGTILGDATFALDNAGANKRGVALGNNGGGLAAVSGNTMTVDGVVSGSGPLTVGIPASSANFSTVGLVPGTGNGASTANAAVYATGTVNLIGANTYSGNTLVSSGTLMLSNTATIGSTPTITVASGAVFDVSQLTSTFTLGGSQSLAGIGTNNGSVTTSSGSKIYADAGVPYGTNTFNNNLTFVSGAVAYLSLGTVYNGSNDFISVGGTLTLNSTTIHLKAPSTSANLDTTANYVLMTAASLSGTPSSTPIWDVAPANAANYIVTTSGNSVVLQYSASAPPSGTGTATPASVNQDQSTFIAVTVTPGTYPISSVVLNASPIGGSSSVTLVQSNSTSVYTNTVTVAAATAPGPLTLVATISDTSTPTPLTGTVNIALTVLNTETWNGNGANGNWSNGANWVSGVSPVTGDLVTFAGSLQTAPNMDSSYNLTGLAFASGAASFTLGTSGNFLTLTADGITNNSANTQTVNMPITLTAPQTFNANAGNLILEQGITNGGNLLSVDGANISTISGAISGSGGLAKNGAGTNYLTGSDSYGGTTTINAGSLVLNGNHTLPGAITINSGNNTMLTVSGGTLNSSSLTMDSANASLGFELSGGTASFSGNVAFSADNGNNAIFMQLTNGVFNAASFTSGRCNLSLTAQPATGQATSEGIYINGSTTVNITNTLGIGGLSGNANSSTSFRMDGGTVNVGGTTRITINNSGRWSVLDVNGGTFTSTDATGTGIQIGGGYGGASAELLVRAGKLIADTITLGDTNGIQTNGTVVLNQTGGSIYLGSGGIVSGSNAPTYGETITLGSGTVGALANWSSSLPMTLSGTMTFQAADGNNNPFNIALNGALSGSAALNKTGGGTLTLGAADTYTGNTLINGGTLALGPGGAITSPNIILGSGTALDVSQVSGFTLSASQTLKGFGSVTGMVAAASGATIYPGSNSLTGTLTLVGGLTENGGVNNTFNLSSNPSGPNNDFINAAGGLNLSGNNTITIFGSLANGGIYPLFYYGGSLSGDVTDFSVSGAVGTLSNSVTASTIYFVNLTSFRAPTNVVWLGNPINNVWDTETTTNWLDNGAGQPDIFVPTDTVLFNNVGTGNPLVNIPGLVNPSSVTVQTASSYTFSGTGAIGGAGSLTVSNGSLTVLTANSYTGPTILAGGVLSTPNLANSGSSSGIGAATADPGNLIFNGGTLAYSGASVGTDHGLTLTNGGGTLDVIGGTTLTLNGNLFGNGGLTLIDSGTLTLATANTYAGGTTISNGVLNLNNATAAGTGAINVAGGTLELTVGGQPTYANALNVIGNSTLDSAGGNNNILTGAWSGNSNAVLNVSISSGGTFTVEGSMTNFYGTVELGSDAGFFRFNGSGNTTSGGTNATFDLGTATATLEARNPTTIAIGALEGGSSTIVTGPSSGAGTLIWAIGSSTNNPSTTYSGTIKDDAANENSGIIKIGTGTLTLAGNNPYTAGTTVSSGALVVSGGLTGVGAVTVSGGTLGGSGSISGATTVQTAGTLEPGFGVSTAGTVLTLKTNLTLNTGSTNIMQVSHNNQNSDNIASSGTIAYGGTLMVVTNAGDAPFVLGDTFTLFTSSLPGYSGRFTSFNLPPLSAGLAWNTGNLTVNGTISVVSATPPSLSSILVSGANITLTSTNGSAGGQVIVLMSTDLTLPVNQWTPLTTNNYDGTGSFSYTVTGAVTSGQPQQFYRLQTQ